MSSSSLRQQKRKKEIKQCTLKLRELSKKGDNAKCADCNQKNPKWVSVTIGCWVCMKCSGYHRNLGTHISFIKSISLDHWSYDLLRSFKKLGGNRAIKSLYGDNKIDYNKMNDYKIQDWIREKYVKKLFAKNKTKKINNKKPKIPRKQKKKKVQSKIKPEPVPDTDSNHNSIDSDPKNWVKFNDSKQNKEKKKEEAPKDMIPDLMGIDAMKNFHFLSDLAMDDEKQNGGVPTMDPLDSAQNTENAGKCQNCSNHRLSKDVILSKYNNNTPETWMSFQSPSPRRVGHINQINYNYYNPYNPYLNAPVINNMNVRHYNPGHSVKRSSKEMILSKFGGSKPKAKVVDHNLFKDRNNNNNNDKAQVANKENLIRELSEIFGNDNNQSKVRVNGINKNVNANKSKSKSNENRNVKQVQMGGFDPFNHINSLCNNSGHYVYGNVSC